MIDRGEAYTILHGLYDQEAWFSFRKK